MPTLKSGNTARIPVLATVLLCGFAWSGASAAEVVAFGIHWAAHPAGEFEVRCTETDLVEVPRDSFAGNWRAVHRDRNDTAEHQVKASAGG